MKRLESLASFGPLLIQLAPCCSSSWPVSRSSRATILRATILRATAVPLPAFQIAGGIVSFLFVMTMIFGESKPEQETKMLRSFAAFVRVSERLAYGRSPTSKK